MRPGAQDREGNLPPPAGGVDNRRGISSYPGRKRRLELQGRPRRPQATPMKRSLLSSFDPLPHALSTKGLSALVAIVVLGIGVTVARYLESSTGPARRSGAQSVLSRPGEVRAAP